MHVRIACLCTHALHRQALHLLHGQRLHGEARQRPPAYRTPLPAPPLSPLNSPEAAAGRGTRRKSMGGTPKASIRSMRCGLPCCGQANPQKRVACLHAWGRAWAVRRACHACPLLPFHCTVHSRPGALACGLPGPFPTSPPLPAVVALPVQESAAACVPGPLPPSPSSSSPPSPLPVFAAHAASYVARRHACKAPTRLRPSPSSRPSSGPRPRPPRSTATCWTQPGVGARCCPVGRYFPNTGAGTASVSLWWVRLRASAGHHTPSWRVAARDEHQKFWPSGAAAGRLELGHERGHLHRRQRRLPTLVANLAAGAVQSLRRWWGKGVRVLPLSRRRGVAGGEG